MHHQQQTNISTNPLLAFLSAFPAARPNRRKLRFFEKVFEEREEFVGRVGDSGFGTRDSVGVLKAHLQKAGMHQTNFVKKRLKKWLVD